MFERTANISLAIFSNSMVFLCAIVLIIYWFATRDWADSNKTDIIRDIIVSITFLTFFIIQRVFNHFAQSLHLKVGELVAAHDKARNHLIKAEEKTDEELKELAKEHDKIIAKTNKNDKSQHK